MKLIFKSADLLRVVDHSLAAPRQAKQTDRVHLEPHPDHPNNRLAS